MAHDHSACQNARPEFVSRPSILAGHRPLGVADERVRVAVDAAGGPEVAREAVVLFWRRCRAEGVESRGDLGEGTRGREQSVEAPNVPVSAAFERWETHDEKEKGEKEETKELGGEEWP